MTCTKNCNQGRACDCVADLTIQYADDDAAPMDLSAGEFITVALYTVCMLGLGFFIGRMFA